MSPSVQGTQGSGRLDVLALSELLAAQRQGKGGTIVPGSQESVKTLLESMAGFSDLLPELEEPSTGTARASVPGGLSMGGLSLETLLDAVGFEQRRTETRAGISSLEARAQERAEANEEKIKSIQEQLEKSKSQGFLDGLLKAFKYIGMALAAIGSVAMIAAGAVVNRYCQCQQMPVGDCSMRLFMGDWIAPWLIFSAYALAIGLLFLIFYRTSRRPGA